MICLSKRQVDSHLFPHDIWVRSIDEDWMGKPSQLKLNERVAGLNVRGIVRIRRLCPENVQRYADLSTLKGCKLCFVEPLHGWAKTWAGPRFGEFCPLLLLPQLA